MKLIILSLIFLLVPLHAFSAEADADLKEKLQKLNTEMAQAMIDGKSVEALKLYTDDAISLPNYSPMLRGKDAIKRHFEEMDNAGYKFHDFKMTTLIVKEVGDVIHEIGTYSLSLTPPGMTERVEDKGKYLTIWKKQPDGSLRIILDTYNTDAYPM